MTNADLIRAMSDEDLAGKPPASRLFFRKTIKSVSKCHRLTLFVNKLAWYIQTVGTTAKTAQAVYVLSYMVFLLSHVETVAGTGVGRSFAN